jgi:erythronate-4-phosphate dehydrogenase
LSEAYGLDLTKMSLGVVGVGNVGSKVRRVGEALGMKCVLNDPPLSRITGDTIYRPINEILKCDIVTLHVPLTKEGPDATRYLANDDFFGRIKPGAILINSSRGAVVEGAALHRALESGRVRAVVLDVWENEPNIDRTLLSKVFIGTPHIAGYSFDGKVNGTRQIYEAACDFLGVEPTWSPAALLPAPECPETVVDPDDPNALLKAVRAVYDIRRNDEAMRKLLSAPEGECGKMFDQLRKEYPRRREFFNTRACMTREDVMLGKKLAGLGFPVTCVTS